MIQLSLSITALVLLMMALLCLRFMRDQTASPSESFLKSYVYLFGAVLLMLGLSIVFMAARYRGIEVYLAAFAVLLAGSYMLFFPRPFRSLLLWVLNNVTDDQARYLALFNTLVCFLSGIALVYFAFR